MDQIAKIVMLAGFALFVLGGVLWLLVRLGFKGLPGDLTWRSGHMTVVFPIVTCIVVSLLLTAAMWLWQWFSNR